MSDDRPLSPVLTALRSMFGTVDLLPGVAPGLLVPDTRRWAPAARLADDLLPELLERAARRWQAQPHAAASLAWKAYTYWLALPAVLGFAVARRVPLLTGDAVLVRFDDPRSLVTFGLRPDITVAALPGDPLAGTPGVLVVADDDELLAALRRSLLDEHLTPLLDAMHGAVRIGRRVLLGSLASGIAYGLLRVAGDQTGATGRVLSALDLADLIELTPAGRVHRRTCCLAFTLPRPKICADCCLPPRP
ncbi:IucA/IucC family C-terminal-domain containing protein [Actinoplanes sp. NPDC026619]|uniref:IucA/IucC family C-terminal-domain containing protein n=1 Tax=Actinoplanes sp. NPDC026619 TaxID=3155798 RepID=UPI0034063485